MSIGKEKQPIFIDIGKQGFDELAEFTNRVTKQILPQEGKNATGRDNFSVTDKGIVSSDKSNNQGKQIEEMADIIFNSRYKNDYISPLKGANELYNAGYRKIDKDSVVLSREEYTKNLNTHYYMGQREVEEEYKTIYILRERKETAEKILNAQYQECKIAEQDVLKARGGNKKDDYYKGFSLGMANTKMHIQELAKQLDIEIKE